MNALKNLFVLVILFMSLPVASFAAQVPVWVEVTGEAYLGEIETPKEVKERALREAQKKALEQAVGTFIKSHTVVSNSQIEEDLIYASVRGKIEKTKIVRAEWNAEQRDQYNVTIRALIRPVYPEKGEGLSLKAALSKTALKEGEEVTIFYEVSSDCYVYIFSIAADGSVTLLFPNSIHSEHFIKAGAGNRFPPAGSPISMKAMLLPGFQGNSARESIKVIATIDREEILPLGFHEGMFKVYDARSTGMISDLVKRLNRIDPDRWIEATASYTITK